MLKQQLQHEQGLIGAPETQIFSNSYCAYPEL